MKTEQLIEKAKNDHSVLRKLKMLAVECHLYELGAELRHLENEIFPETESAKKAKKESIDLNLLFRMVDLSISEKTCWIIAETIRTYQKRKGKFTLKDASDIKHTANEFFD